MPSKKKKEDEENKTKHACSLPLSCQTFLLTVTFSRWLVFRLESRFPLRRFAPPPSTPPLLAHHSKQVAEDVETKCEKAALPGPHKDSLCTLACLSGHGSGCQLAMWSWRDENLPALFLQLKKSFSRGVCFLTRTPPHHPTPAPPWFLPPFSSSLLQRLCFLAPTRLGWTGQVWRLKVAAFLFLTVPVWPLRCVSSRRWKEVISGRTISIECLWRETVTPFFPGEDRSLILCWIS